jgi:hypothetical protein
MLITTKRFPFRCNAFAPGQMHAAVDAPHHILTFQGARLLMRLFTLFERPPVAPYYPEKKDDNKDEKKNSTHGIVSVDASELAAHTGKAEDLAFYPLHGTVQDIGDGSSGNGIKVLNSWRLGDGWLQPHNAREAAGND